MDSFRLLLLATSVAALMSALGVLPLIGRGRVPRAWVGWSDALAGGMMLGLAYLLTGVALVDLISGGVGVFLGVLFIFATRSAIGELTASASSEPSPRTVRQILLEGLLHSAAEGIAIAAAWAADPRFGLFMALAVGVHNIPEGTLFAATQRRRGSGLFGTTLLVVAANLTQVVLAVGAWMLLAAVPGATAWLTGFAAGALVQLVMAELLPDAYRYSGATSIALVTAVAMGVVVFGGGLLL